jgi:hypothetical protein
MLADIVTTVMMIQWFDIIRTIDDSNACITLAKTQLATVTVCHIPFTHALNVDKFQSKIPQCA